MSRYAERLDETLPEVRDAVARAAERAGRAADDVRIVAVTKGHPWEAVAAAAAAGIRDVAENRVGELERKVAEFGGDGDLRWHMVGHVQRRKAPRLLPIVNLVHSLDSLRLARRFQRVAEEAGMEMRTLVQVNTSGEDSKYGFSPDGFREALEEMLGLSRVRVEGLMTMAPFTDDEGVLRAAFRGLRELHQEAGERPGYEGTEVSMGMSNDYAIAVEEGSTMIRVGTALFGERPR